MASPQDTEPASSQNTHSPSTTAAQLPAKTKEIDAKNFLPIQHIFDDLRASFDREFESLRREFKAAKAEAKMAADSYKARLESEEEESWRKHQKTREMIAAMRSDQATEP